MPLALLVPLMDFSLKRCCIVITLAVTSTCSMTGKRVTIGDRFMSLITGCHLQMSSSILTSDCTRLAYLPGFMP